MLMESRIEELLSKYWEGESSLDEENELKEYFNQNPHLTPTGLFFRGLKKRAEEKPKGFSHPGKKSNTIRYSIAASIAVVVTVGVLIYPDQNRHDDFEIEDPQEAYEIARTALMKMSTSLNDGQVHSLQLKKINEAEEAIKEEKL